MDCLMKLENEHLGVEIREDCSATIRDKKSGAEWTTSAVAPQDYGRIMEEVVWSKSERSFVDYYPGRFRATREGGRLSVRLFGRLEREMGMFTCRPELDGEWLVFHVEDVDEALPSLVFPPYIECDSLILPSGLGRWIREESYYCQFINQSGMTMRWFGGLKADNDRGYMAVYENGFEDSGLYAKGLRVAPAWMKSMERWSPTRSIRYRCTTNGYVGMAKVFRRYAQEHGFFRSLEEKIAECPAVGALHGGRVVSFFQGYTDLKFDPIELLHPFPGHPNAGTGGMLVNLSHADVATIITDAKALGMKKGVFNLRGAFRGGYDYSHPDIWPPAPALGTLDELKAIMSADGDFVAMLHDNYQDFYPRAESFPDGVIRTSTDGLLVGGFWHGGQCYILNSRAALRYAMRNWEHLKTLGCRGAFVDTMACVQGYEDYNPECRLDRAGTYAAKLDMMKFYKDQGVLLGSENAGGFGMAHIDLLENRHRRVPGETPPIWPLVFHDAAFCCRYPGGNTSTVGAVGEVEDILWGYAVMWAAGTPELWRKGRDEFRKSLFVDEWHARVGTDAMTDHRYLTEDWLVEQTEFSSGVSVVANFADEPRTVEGRSVPAGDYIILD